VIAIMRDRRLRHASANDHQNEVAMDYRSVQFAE
jgi:hypothetical protein